MVNTGRIGEDKKLQDVFRKFLKNPKNGLKRKGPVRLVCIYTGEFVVMLRKLRHAGHLAFDSRLFAKALDVLHAKMWDESYPETEDWMATSMLETIAEGLSREKSLLDVAEPPSPYNSLEPVAREKGNIRLIPIWARDFAQVVSTLWPGGPSGRAPVRQCGSCGGSGCDLPACRD